MRSTFDGRVLSYDDAGHGPAVILLHPFPLDRRYWRNLLTAWSPALRVLSLDARGFGDAQPDDPAQPEPAWAIADLADDACALMDDLGLARASVVGLSMGGYAALAFAARHRERLDRLVLADTKAAADTAAGKAARDAALALVDNQGVAAFMEGQVPKLLSANAGFLLRDQVNGWGSEQNPAAVMMAIKALRDRPDRQGELASITAPTLVIVGADDALTPAADAAALVAGIPGAKLVTLPGAGHLSSLEQPTGFARAVLDHLVGHLVGSTSAPPHS